jgi:lipid-A-disaccharide synthase-like uncharacterized protein
MWGTLVGHYSVREILWILFGFSGQILFSLRFIIQWLASEKAKKTVIPQSFWIYSILGSIVLSTYAIYRKDPVFILGQLPSVFIYFRNILLNKRNSKQAQENNGAETHGL